MITINITYYNEPHLLKPWYEFMLRLRNEGADVVCNICDDGSQLRPAEDFFDENVPPPNIRLFRVKEDLGFNSHGCRNLLMQQSFTDWNLLTDIDRSYPMKTILSIIALDQMREGEYYTFTSANGKGSHNDFVVHANDFWKTYGYDEEFTNVHWGDRPFLDVLQTEAKLVQRKDWTIVYTRHARDVQFVDTVEFTEYPDDNTLIHPTSKWGKESYRKSMKDYIARRNANVATRRKKKIINFEWEQVF